MAKTTPAKKAAPKKATTTTSLPPAQSGKAQTDQPTVEADDNGAVKSHLGYDAEELAALSDAERAKVAPGVTVDPIPESTKFPGRELPGGHVNDPTVPSVVGSRG